jgi:hypothetical protein
VVLPLALLMVDTIFSIFVVALLAKIASDPSKNQSSTVLLSRSYVIFYASMAATNIYVTCEIISGLFFFFKHETNDKRSAILAAIVFQISRVARRNRDGYLGRLYDACCIISGSGIPFTLVTVVGLVTKAIAMTSGKSGLQSYTLDAIVSVINQLSSFLVCKHRFFI